MALRRGQFRERYDPEEDVGLPRPFLLGDDKTHKPVLQHSTAQPKKAKPFPKDKPIPAYKPIKWSTLPHQDKRYKDITAKSTRVYYLTKAQVLPFTKFWKKAFGIWFQVNVVKGAVEKGVFIVLYEKGNAVALQRAPGYMQPGYKTDTEAEYQRRMLYLWKHDRPAYWREQKKVAAFRAKKDDENRRLYDDAVANEKNRRAQERYEYNLRVREYNLAQPPRW